MRVLESTYAHERGASAKLAKAPAVRATMLSEAEWSAPIGGQSR